MMNTDIIQEVQISEDEYLDVVFSCEASVDYIEEYSGSDWNSNSWRTTKVPIVEKIFWDKESYTQKQNEKIEKYIKKNFKVLAQEAEDIIFKSWDDI